MLADKKTKNKVARFLKIYSIHAALSADFAFWIIINSIWLLTVRKFTVAEVATLELISTIIVIIAMILLTKITSNVKSSVTIIKVGNFLGVISPLLLLTSGNQIVVIVALSSRMVSKAYTNLNAVALKNSLHEINKEEDFVTYKSKGNFKYSVITMGASLITAPLYAVNIYLPLIIDLVLKVIAFMLSFLITDFPDETIKTEPKKSIKKMIPTLKKNVNITPTILILMYAGLMSMFAVLGFYTKILIQLSLEVLVSTTTVVAIISYIVVINRISRMLSSFLYPKIDKKLTCNILLFLLIISILAISLGFIASIPVKFEWYIYVQIALGTLSFIMYPALRQGVTTSCHEKMLLTSSKKIYNEVIYAGELIRYVLDLILQTIVVLIVATGSLAGLFVIALVILFIMVKLYFKYVHNQLKTIDSKTCYE